MRSVKVFLALILLSAAARADEQGLYVNYLGDCQACHTAPGGKPYAGSLPINSPFGTIYSSNITPDKEFGIGNYSLEDFTRVMRKGIKKDGSHLYPAMPYTAYAHASDEDIKALYTYYMQDVAPVHEKAKPTKLPFPFNQRWGLALWNLFFFDSSHYKQSKEHDALWNRGAYLAQSWGHCSACHSPRGPAYEETASPRSKKYLTGEELDHWYAPNLRSGLKDWSEGDVAAFLKDGHGHGTAAFGNMTQVVEDSSQYMSDDDRHALAHYLLSLADNKNEKKMDRPVLNYASEKPGAGLYMNYCASCHTAEGVGKLPKYPSLAGNSAITAADGTSVMRIVLEGGATANTQFDSPVKMPGFGGRLTDQEVADVVTYVRNSWGNQAPLITARNVEVLRVKLKKSSGQTTPASSPAKPQ